MAMSSGDILFNKDVLFLSGNVAVDKHKTADEGGG